MEQGAADGNRPGEREQAQGNNGQREELEAQGLTVLSNEDKLKIYLKINLRQFVVSNFRKLFKSRRGNSVAPNYGIRGASKNYVETMDAINEYLSWDVDKQKEVNTKYKDETLPANKRKDKDICFKLNSEREKLKAIRDFGSPRGLEIAAELQFSTEGIDDIIDSEDEEEEEEEEEALDPHLGLASGTEGMEILRRDRENNRRRKKPRLSDESTKVEHLSRKCHSDNFFVATEKVARANDATFLDPVRHPGAPMRTIVMISINEVKDVGEAGGKVPNNNRRKKTKVTLVADSIEKFSKVMKILNDALGRTEASNPEDYEVENIFRNEEECLTSVLKDRRESFIEGRRCPSRKRVSEADILASITNRYGEIGPE